jgi:ribosomal protein L29
MKTTLEIPDAVFRQAKAAAAERGIPLRALITEALADSLRARKENQGSKPWMKTFGKLRHLQKDIARINRIIEEEFEQIEDEDRK